MEVREVPLTLLREAPYNPNTLDGPMRERLSRSLERFGTVLPLVVRPLADGYYEVIGGNQRLRLYRERGVPSAPCVAVRVHDLEARLLAQALNRIHGEDDLNRKAALVRELLAELPADEVAKLLPDSPEALQGLAELGRQTPASLAEALSAWDRARAVRLEQVSFAFSPAQREIVEEALACALPRVAGTEAPNRRALALVLVCREWLQLQAAVEAGPAAGRWRR